MAKPRLELDEYVVSFIYKALAGTKTTAVRRSIKDAFRGDAGFKPGSLLVDPADDTQY